ncbi:transcription factor bHLH91-like [Malania oleifera]|uniref:transcription factor bHLH91-like n=1 Tax=Malania oleifera TaxID=397392 RepID=UPI0025AEB822|nr:transcription factor bHLH91-like [Malania oleifera]XP_057977953.1 transcription factor bHLH91-like [Malania oleifera]
MYHEDAASSFDPNSTADDGFSQTGPTIDCPVLPPPPPLVPANTTEDQNNIQLPNFSVEQFSNSQHRNPPPPDHHQDGGAAAAAAAVETEALVQQQLLQFEMDDRCYNNSNNNNTHLMQEAAIHDSNHLHSHHHHHHHHHEMVSYDHHNQQCMRNNWDTGDHVHEQMQDLGVNGHQVFMNNSSLPADQTTPLFAPAAPELLNLFHLPRCSASGASSLLPNIGSSSISFATAANPNHNSASMQAASSLGLLGDHLPNSVDINATAPPASGTVLFDPLFHLNLSPQPPLFRELFQSLPRGYSLPASGVGAGSLFGSTDGCADHEHEMLSGGHAYHSGDHHGVHFDNGVLEFTRDIDVAYKARSRGLAARKGTKHFATERQRREHLNDKFKALGSLVPNPTKADRASVVGDAIEYIKELRRTVNELKILVEKKRCGSERSKRHKTTTATDQADTIINATAAAAAGEMDIESCSINKLLGFGGAGADADQSSYANNGSLRSSWLQRKSKDTEVDVRIVEDEVNIKLVQRKRINCLLYVSKTLDELHLDLHHVAGGHIGDHYSFLFNTKIYEGSSVYASAIANKLIESVDRQYSATPSTTSF